jgi:hypothetical protein
MPEFLKAGNHKYERTSASVGPIVIFVPIFTAAAQNFRIFAKYKFWQASASSMMRIVDAGVANAIRIIHER